MHGAFETDIEHRGVIQASARLRPTSDATTVPVRDGKVLISDGPFAETKEQIGGDCPIDRKDRDDAIQVASQLPGARTGTIEVRPIWELEVERAPIEIAGVGKIVLRTGVEEQLGVLGRRDERAGGVGVPTNLVRGDVFFWQSLMASAVIIAVPVALIYNFFLDRFVQGFTLGAVKG